CARQKMAIAIWWRFLLQHRADPAPMSVWGKDAARYALESDQPSLAPLIEQAKQNAAGIRTEPPELGSLLKLRHVYRVKKEKIHLGTQWGSRDFRVGEEY